MTTDKNGDRMGTASNDMRCIKEYFFLQMLASNFLSYGYIYHLKKYSIGLNILRITVETCWQISLFCPHAFKKSCSVATLINNRWQKLPVSSPGLSYICLCLCRLCTRARRKAGRSTAQHRTQMGSVSVPWSHQPRTCVTATHAAGSSASSWRRWQLSITHSLTLRHDCSPRRHINSHAAMHCARVWHRLSNPGCWS